MDKEQSIERIMKGLQCSRAEAEDVYKYDQAVNRDQPTEYDLDRKSLNIARKYTHTGTRKKPMIPNLTPRQRKSNPIKEKLIQGFMEYLQAMESVESVEVINKERQIGFTIGGDKYEITLVKKNKPKEGK